MKEDLNLRLKVKGELAAEWGINPSRLGVAVQHGTVTLSGTVQTLTEKLAAVRAAQRVVGRFGVVDALRIDVAQVHRRTDEEILQAAQESLWLIPHEGVSVRVQGGWVTLEGEVNWQFQRQSAHEAVAHLLGVRGIEDLIVVKPRECSDPEPRSIEASIRDAFERHSDLDAEQVRVLAVHGHVTLSGHLASRDEYQEATRAAWKVPCVTSVDNQISFGPQL